MSTTGIVLYWCSFIQFRVEGIDLAVGRRVTIRYLLVDNILDLPRLAAFASTFPQSVGGELVELG